ncbi:hypothetical protein NFI96_028615 [Prochilodus magdalenae]|nr:hypothetical protein NFI96_028615 [Prochilodus magdalenae]
MRQQNINQPKKAFPHLTPSTFISQDLKWETNNNSFLKKAEQRMYFLRLLKLGLPQELLIQFYTAVTESVLCTSITVWFGVARTGTDYKGP